MFGATLKALRLEKGYTQSDLAKLLNVTPKTISFYELDQRFPPNETLVKIATIFNVTTDYLLGREVRVSSKRVCIKIPVLGRIVAETPIDSVGEILDYEEINLELALTGEYFAFKISGSSMEPKFSQGDVVIVKKQPYIRNGEIAVILINGSEATVKKVKKEEKGITLIGSNTVAYEPQFYTNEEVEQIPITILGRVIELRARF